MRRRRGRAGFGRSASGSVLDADPEAVDEVPAQVGAHAATVATPARASRRAPRRLPRRCRTQAMEKSARVTSIVPACTMATRVAAPVVVARSWAPVMAVGTAVTQPVSSRASTAAACFSPSTRSSSTAISQAPIGTCTATGCTRCPSHPPPSRSSRVGRVVELVLRSGIAGVVGERDRAPGRPRCVVRMTRAGSCGPPGWAWVEVRVESRQSTTTGPGRTGPPVDLVAACGDGPR